MTEDTYVLDTYSWIEYFRKSEKGEQVKTILEDEKNHIFTAAITLSELASIMKRKQLNYDKASKLIHGLSTVQTHSIANHEQAGKLHANLKKKRKSIGLADTLILQTAYDLNAQLVTGDQDFNGLRHVVMI